MVARALCLAVFLLLGSDLRATQVHKFQKYFGSQKPIIGMIHLAGQNRKDILARAITDLEIYENLGVSGVIIENYYGSIEDIEALLSEISGRYRRIKIGLNVLPNRVKLAFRLAHRYGLNFIQLDFVAGRYENASGPPLFLRPKKFLKRKKSYPEILVLGGVHPKFYKPIVGSDLEADLAQAKRLADVIVVTGDGIESGTPIKKIQDFRRYIGSDFPLIVGSGVDINNFREQLSIADGAIVGSYFKNGDTSANVSATQVINFMQAVDRLIKK